MEQNLKILILEDFPSDADLMELELVDEGLEFSSRIVETRGEFVEGIEEFKPDLILSDYKLPDFDGLSALEIRNEKTPDTPFIFVSGVIGAEHAVETLKKGATDYVLKDNLSKLVPAVKRALKEVEEIYDLKKVENALKESEDRFRQVAESTEEWIWEVDTEGLYTYSSPVLEKMLGYKPEEVVGKMHFYDLFVPEEREELKKEAMESFAMKKPFNGSVNTNLHKTGSKVILETNGTPMLDKEGKLLGYRGSDTNITDRKKADEQIKLQNKTLEGINQIFKKAITVDSEDEVAKRSLEVCEEITDSKFGFILERNIHGNLDALAISNPGWDECLMEKSDAIIILKDMKERGIHGKASKDGKSFFTNDPSNQEDSIGAPEGHPDIHSFLGVPFTQRDEIIGSIGLGNKENGYDTEDLQILERLSIAISESLMRKRAENSLKIVLDEKEMLLKEIHHRVKNNLMIISSLLNLQSSYIKDKESKDIFKESQNRARSMALIHERLYQSTDLKRMDFGDYIRSLSTELFNTYTANPSIIKLKINVEDILLDINTAVPLGLIVNELVTNSLKHAFPEGMRGEINVDFHPTDDHYEFTVKDNGIGFPEDLDFQNTDSLGMQIVTSLTNQIDGEIEIDRNNGTKFKITFKEDYNED